METGCSADECRHWIKVDGAQGGRVDTTAVNAQMVTKEMQSWSWTK